MISVVIPVYNKSQSITSTLQSVFAQTYTDYEVVIVDDGSTDGSGAICETYIREIKNHNSEIKNVRLLSQANAGVSAARNAGILVAKGEYIAFLDGDDLWEKDFLLEMAQLITDYPGKSIYGLGCAQIKRGEKFVLKDTYYRGISTWNYKTMAFTGSSSCVHRADAIQVGLFDTRITHGEDLDMWWRLMLLHGGASYMKPFSYYIQDAENRAMNHIPPLEKHIPYFIDKFSKARAENIEFRRFFDREIIYRLYPYLFDNQYFAKAKQLAQKLDYSLQKNSMKWRMYFPNVYRIYLKLIN